jgi:hypothetical protein
MCIEDRWKKYIFVAGMVVMGAATVLYLGKKQEKIERNIKYDSFVEGWQFALEQNIEMQMEVAQARQNKESP